MFDLTTYVKKWRIRQLKTVFSTLDTLCIPYKRAFPKALESIRSVFRVRKCITVHLRILQWIIFGAFKQLQYILCFKVITFTFKFWGNRVSQWLFIKTWSISYRITLLHNWSLIDGSPELDLSANLKSKINAKLQNETGTLIGTVMIKLLFSIVAPVISDVGHIRSLSGIF